MIETPLQVKQLGVAFPVRTGGIVWPKMTPLRAVDNVSFDLAAGETLGIVGESGCGKSTLARAILKLVPPASGAVSWLGHDIASLDHQEMNRLRDGLQIVFQDPLSSHNPRITVGTIISEPLTVFRKDLDAEDRRNVALDMMKDVGLTPEYYNRYPHELSGGQCQRVSIARALILKPKLLVCDEPVSSLDVSTQGQIINLIRRVQKEYGLAIIFISHDLSVVRYVCERIIVMYLGQIVEKGTRESLFDRPLHPYTRALIASVPQADPHHHRVRVKGLIKGDIPSPLNPPSGCVFRTRCPKSTTACVKISPLLETKGPNREVACHYPEESGT